MALNVLLIDSDVEALSELASSLRARGLSITLADSFAVAVDQAQKLSLDAILVAEAMTHDNQLAVLFDAEPSLTALPCFELVNATECGTTNATIASAGT